MINKNSKIYIAGHKGLVGSAILKKLKLKGYKNILVLEKKKLNLLNQIEVFKFLTKEKPKFIFICAAKVGGIYSNIKYRAEYIYENITIQNNLIHGAFKAGVRNLIFMGTSCVYPRNSKQPMKENYLLSGYLEQTNEPYAIAKIAGIKMCEAYNARYNTNYRTLMPSNIYGPNDNYDNENSHFIASLIKKIHFAKLKKNKSIILWGNGSAKREVIHVDDVADACLFFMRKKIKEPFINIGSGKDYSIKQYANKIINVLLPKEKILIKYDSSKPNGMPRKLLDVSLAKSYGWKPKITLEEGIKNTYINFLKQ